MIAFISGNTHRMFRRAAFFILTSLLVFSQIGFAAEKNKSLMVLHAAKELSVMSQSIVKDYFYIAKNLNALQSRAQMKKYREKIDENINFLKANVKDTEIKDMLEFMTITVEEMNELLEAPYTENNAFLVMDMSEVLLEGGDSMSKKLSQYVRVEHKMLDLVEHQLYLIERMAKLYIAAKAGLYDYNSQQQMKTAITEYDAGVKDLASHNYPATHMTKVAKLKKHWAASKKFYAKAESGSVPRTVFLATELMGYQLRALAKYHVEGGH